MSNLKWNELTSVAQLEEIDQISQSQPVLIFKHSIRCSISAATLNRFESKWDTAEAGELKPYYLDLITYREVSNQIAAKYGVNHQSPQAIIVVGGKAIFDASHFGISFKAVAEHAKLASA
ncbi:MAG: bacillithiol system redox-active protein YtxJ [Cyclobacteriaceae bacterium]